MYGLGTVTWTKVQGMLYEKVMKLPMLSMSVSES